MRFTISSEERLAMDVMPTGVVIHRPQGPRGGRMSVISVRNEDIPFLAKVIERHCENCDRPTRPEEISETMIPPGAQPITNPDSPAPP
ncbi:hypothetical protein [Rhizobium leguminosarum]|uniref:hypothetical protein n=1 Tax=Rhizobium leguminosarum TaxID=384 RepID=UPI0004ADBD95|nr:hypothetical protein [Rhizobium leguminosarum]